MDGPGINVNCLDDGSYEITVQIYGKKDEKKNKAEGYGSDYRPTVRRTLSAKDQKEAIAEITKYLPAITKAERTENDRFSEAFAEATTEK